MGSREGFLSKGDCMVIWVVFWENRRSISSGTTNTINEEDEGNEKKTKTSRSEQEAEEEKRKKRKNEDEKKEEKQVYSNSGAL